MEWNASTYIEDWAIAKNFRSHNRKKLFRTDKEMAEELVRLAVNKRLLLGRYLLFFPYLVEGKSFQTTSTFKWLCWLAAVFLTVLSISLAILSNNKNDSFMFLLLGPLISSYSTLLINQIWIHAKKDKLDDFLANLQECRPYLEVDSKGSTIYSLLPTFCQFLLNMCFWFCVVYKRQPINITFTLVYLYFVVGLFLCYAMLEQFILLLSLVRQQLSRTAVLSDRDQDALIAAAIDLNKVFSPHLLVIITIFFVALLGKIYKTVILREINDIKNIMIIVLQCFPIWRIVSHCQTFVKEVDHLHDRTYHYLLTNEHKIEKRLEFHLAMKRKFVFSAGGMFNVDYQLLCGMVTTAATYIVVLLQFTVDKDGSGPDDSTILPQT